MPYSNKLKKLADEQKMSVPELVKRAIAEHGTEFKAAASLGVYINAVRYWLAKDTEKQASKN